MKEVQVFSVQIKQYDGNVKLVQELTELIDQKYSNIFHSVIVHGSVATNEVIPYSDFDGLLIVKDEFKDSEALRRFKKESLRSIYKFDPYQHHGWFQILESQLLNYPEDYLPLAILEHSKLVFPKKDHLSLSISQVQKPNYKKGLIEILSAFEKRHAIGWKPKNQFELKSMLSQIMLLPSMYYAIIHNQGIFKRESFDAVKSKFNSNEWTVIETATTLRAQWVVELNGIQKALLTSTSGRLRKLVIKLFAPKLKSFQLKLLNDDFYKHLYQFIIKIKENCHEL